MGALMLIFAMAVSGEAGTMALQYPTMEACEADRISVITMLKDSPSPSGAPVVYVAVACVVPTEVDVI